MRLLGVDWGRVRVGLAISDEAGFMAHPLEVLPGAGPEPLANRLAEVAAREKTEKIVLGLPKNMDGSEGDSAALVRRLAAALQAKGLSVEFWDERLTSWEAESRLREAGGKARQRKGKLDAAAAALILQGYMDRQRNP